MTKLELSDNFEALVLALELAITTPDESMSIYDFVDQLAGYMQVSEVELAKQIALSNVFEECQ